MRWPAAVQAGPDKEQFVCWVFSSLSLRRAESDPPSSPAYCLTRQMIIIAERERERDGWGHTQINWLGGSSGVKTLEMLTREILGVPDGKRDPNIVDPCWAPNISYHKEFCSDDKIFFETFPNLAVVSPWSQYKLLRVSQTQVRSDLDQPRPFIFQFLIDVGHINSSRQSRLIH